MLRQRVLGAVRGEVQGTERAPLRAGASPRRARPPLAVAAIFVALVVAGAVALNRGYTARPPAQPTATAGGHRARRASLRTIGARTELSVSGMPEPPIGEVYEVWLERASKPAQPTDALFTVTRSGDGAVEVPGNLRGVRAVMVTSEPLGGSSAPTSAAVLRLRVSQRR